MRDFDEECRYTILKVQEKLHDNNEWISRFEDYAKKIHLNLDTIIKNKKKFHKWMPLYLYMNVKEAKGSMVYSLRYLGQDVADLKIKGDNVAISTLRCDKNNETYFGCKIKLKDNAWRSEKSKEFRKYFKANPKRDDTLGMNNEHRIESLLLTEFSKSKSQIKSLCNVQPVLLANIARFQMPTPLSASKIDSLEYVIKGGGIDILARVSRGGRRRLCIMEVKDENVSKEPPSKAILQGLAYATFVLKLLRSKSGEDWWKLFGYHVSLPPKHINLYVACVMPSLPDKCDTTFADKEIKIENDSIHLHYIYFKETKNIITEMTTSIKECKSNI